MSDVFMPPASDTAPVDAPPLTPRERQEALTLLTSVFVVGACGLIYELLTATVSSYLLGSSVTQFSLCIGTFIGAMGLGSWASQYLSRHLLRWFLIIEIALAGIGGVSASLLYAAYATLGGGYYAVLYGLLILIGGLVGLELPLLTRLLHRYGALRTTIAHALSFDYVGSLLGSVAFPLVLLPLWGAARTGFLVGLLNLGVAAYCAWVFRGAQKRTGVTAGLGTAIGLIAVALVCGGVWADKGTALFERRLYEDEILMARQTRYQRIVVTRFRDDLRLYLDGNIQFSASDEYRYHEALVHPAMLLSANHEDVLVLGGGDGLAVREILKHPGVRSVTLVDIDPEMTRLARSYPALVRQNNDALADGRVKVVHTDAYKFLEDGTDRYGVIIADLPDPNNEALAKLYSREFYRLARTRLGRGGILITQSTSPLVSREAFWCVEKTLRTAGFATMPYHVYVPSFGDWGFHLCREGTTPDLSQMRLTDIKAPLRYLNSAAPVTLTAFDGDTSRVPVEVSSLDFPRILSYYEKGTRKWE